MSFSTPAAFALLLVPALLGVLGAFALRRRSKAAVRFAHLDVLAEVAPTQSLLRRALPGALALLALVAMVVGFAGPQRFEKVETSKKRVVLAFDVSNSMMAEDVSPSRLEVAKQAATEFLDSVPEDVDVGLVLFAGSVTLSRPPTSDRESLKAALENAKLGPGTAIGEAIFSGLAMLESTETDPAPEGGEAPTPGVGVIVVLSDGETTSGRSDDEAADAAKDAGVRVSTIAFGTPDGEITLPDQGIQPVPYQPEALAAIAEATGGTAAKASDAGKLGDIFKDLEASVTTEKKSVPYSGWAFGASFVLASAGMALSLAWLRRLG